MLQPFLKDRLCCKVAMHNIISKNHLFISYTLPYTISGYYFEPYTRKTMRQIRITSVCAIIAIYAISFFSCKKEADVKTPEQPQPEEQVSVTPVKGKEYTIVPDKDGRLDINNSNKKYLPGDVLNLKGNFKSINISNMSGEAGKPIIIRNAPGTVTQAGNADWAGGAWAQGLSFVNCHYIILGGDKARTDFIVNGPTSVQRDAYFNIELKEYTDNFEIRNMTIKNGGTGINAKTNPVKTDPNSYGNNAYLKNLLIHDITVDGTLNEAMYIGHTATYWDLTAGTSYYDDPKDFVPGHQYVQPIRWENVKIYNNLVKNISADGIQTAAINKLEVYNNEVTNWGVKQNPSHSGGILIGGRTTNTNTHDNYVHDGWGDLYQFFGSGENGATHVINNNLFVNSTNNTGIILRGTDNAIVQITHNTVTSTAGVSIRINGILGMTGRQQISGNALIQPYKGVGATGTAFIYTENGAQATEGTGADENVKIASLAAAGVDVSNYYQPQNGSPLSAGAGYRKAAK